MATALKIFALDFAEKDNDLHINPATGDFEFVEASQQHIQDILQTNPGEWKEFPAVGCGIMKLLKGKLSEQAVESVIKEQLEADGNFVNRPEVTITKSGKATIQPNATRIRL